MATGTNEGAFEAHVVNYLVNTVQEYQEKHTSVYNKDLLYIEDDNEFKDLQSLVYEMNKFI